MHVHIRGIHELVALDRFDAIISINDPGDELPREVAASDAPVLTLWFHDACADDEEVVFPEAWHLRRVHDFVTRTRPRQLLVHCTAGISRSSAVALFALSAAHPGWSDRRVVRAVLDARPEALPNALIVQLADDATGRNLGGALCTEMSCWR